MSGMRLIHAKGPVPVYAAVASVLVGANVPATASAGTYSRHPAISSRGASYSLSESTPQWKLFVEWGGLRARMIAWESLPAGWDGEDGIAPAKRTINAALAFMQSARAASLPLPTPYIAGDGEVGLRWAKGDAFASVAFLDDGEVVVFVRDAEGVPFEHVQTIDQACPSDVFRGLAAFA